MRGAALMSLALFMSAAVAVGVAQAASITIVGTPRATTGNNDGVNSGTIVDPGGTPWFQAKHNITPPDTAAGVQVANSAGAYDVTWYYVGANPVM